ncbi:hypothetical protein SEVIR_5G337733v4 [Setaria viridis]|uniref:Uncharacterized protein n=1 Tax=Setaria viridis TaxID=4556 RepID=A0A4U6UPT5_SETVI|nr:hypothetical protein SEVIR_5G337733v2 [Setaria viridis]
MSHYLSLQRVYKNIIDKNTLFFFLASSLSFLSLSLSDRTFLSLTIQNLPNRQAQQQLAPSNNAIHQPYLLPASLRVARQNVLPHVLLARAPPHHRAALHREEGGTDAQSSGTPARSYSTPMLTAPRADGGSWLLLQRLAG